MRRLAYSLGSLLSINEVLECSRKLNEIKPEVMWIPETWGMENFSMLGLAAKENTFSKIGSSIINIYSRSPSLIAMGAAIAILFVLPWLDRSPVRSIRHKGMYSKIAIALFVVSFVILGICGALPAYAQPPWLAPLMTVVYFAFFILMPWYTKAEKTKPVPERVTG